MADGVLGPGGGDRGEPAGPDHHARLGIDQLRHRRSGVRQPAGAGSASSGVRLSSRTTRRAATWPRVSLSAASVERAQRQHQEDRVPVERDQLPDLDLARAARTGRRAR